MRFSNRFKLLNRSPTSNILLSLVPQNIGCYSKYTMANRTFDDVFKVICYLILDRQDLNGCVLFITPILK